MGQFARIPGTIMMLQWYAVNWDSLLMVSILCAWKHIHVQRVLSTHIPSGAVAVNADNFREGASPRLLTDLQCFGNESSIFQCGRTEFTGTSCTTAGVVCQGQHVYYQF